MLLPILNLFMQTADCCIHLLYLLDMHLHSKGKFLSRIESFKENAFNANLFRSLDGATAHWKSNSSRKQWFKWKTDYIRLFEIILSSTILFYVQWNSFHFRKMHSTFYQCKVIAVNGVRKKNTAIFDWAIDLSVALFAVAFLLLLYCSRIIRFEIDALENSQ